MEQPSSRPTDLDQPFRIPIAVWVLLAGLAAALVAIFVFNMPLSTVVTFGFFGLMILSHLFMHGGHGSHGTHRNQASSQDGNNTVAGTENNHAGHGCCH